MSETMTEAIERQAARAATGMIAHTPEPHRYDDLHQLVVEAYLRGWADALEAVAVGRIGSGRAPTAA